MKSKIELEIHPSTNKVHFLDETIYLKHGKLRTTPFTKLTDSLLSKYLILPSITCSKNIPKGQFIRLRHNLDYWLNSEILCKKIIECGSHEKYCKKTREHVAKIDRNEL